MKVFAAKRIKLNTFYCADGIVFLRKWNIIQSIDGISNQKYLSRKGRLINIWLLIKKMPQSFVLGTKEKWKDPSVLCGFNEFTEERKNNESYCFPQNVLAMKVWT